MKLLLKQIFGSNNDRVVKKLRKQVEKVNCLEEKYSKMSDAELQACTALFKQDLNNGRTIEDIKFDAFAAIREASKRIMKMRHFDTQILGGIILNDNSITEMKTGEGKTLVATLPAYLNALSGKGVHIVTVNDYLAKRDAEWMGKLYNFMGLSVASIISNIDDKARKQAYQADITYGTNNELGFDFLRDNMKFSPEARVQRLHHYAIVDEVDSILIDESRTPLIISGPVDDNVALYSSINKLVKQITPDLYEIDEKLRSINLKDEGINQIERLLKEARVIDDKSGLYDIGNLSTVHYITQALKANALFKQDVDYVVKDNKVMIIDEFTGRIVDGRRYSQGLHQAIEAKEGVKIQNENQTLASVTFQNYFRMYNKLSGMTGTAMTEAGEFKQIYNLDVIAVPPNIAITRKDYDDQIYSTKADKNHAIITQIKTCYNKGQPVLVGTISIEKSEEISAILNKENIPHNILNAKNHAKEASIIAQAGKYKAITIATNMAGRGTDIQLGGNPEILVFEKHNIHPDNPLYKTKLQLMEQVVESEKQRVIDAGGLYVIGTERHESRRIDNQLRGRSGRQGDPGETTFFLSLDDDLMRIFTSAKISNLLRTLGLKDGEVIMHPMISRALEKAQSKVELNNFEIRKNLLKFDDVMNDQRKIIFSQRNKVINANAFDQYNIDAINEQAEALVKSHIPKDGYREEWKLEDLNKEANLILGTNIDIEKIQNSNLTERDIIQDVIERSKDLLKEKDNLYGKEIINKASQYLMLTIMDNAWKDHLHSLDHLRQGISLRAYGQKDPLNEYKREAFNMFEEMLQSLPGLYIQKLLHLSIAGSYEESNTLSLDKKIMSKMNETRTDPAFAKYNPHGRLVEAKLLPTRKKVSPEHRDPNDETSWGKVSRNDVCPCGSNKKYKHCHG